jgi:hypothetical protein
MQGIKTGAQLFHRQCVKSECKPVSARTHSRKSVFVAAASVAQEDFKPTGMALVSSYANSTRGEVLVSQARVSGFLSSVQGYVRVES